MATCSNIARIVVIVFNCLFMILGLAFFVLGLFLRFGNSAIDKYLSTIETSIESSLQSAGFSTTQIEGDWGSFLLGVSLFFVFLGLFFIFITMMGCCGSCYKIKCMLVLYVVVCSLLLVGQAVLVGLAAQTPDTIKDPMKTGLKDSIKSDYAGLNGTNVVSVSWNILMQRIDCCGVDSYSDFTGASNWVIDYTHLSPAVTLKTPLSCCKTLPSSSDFSCAGASASSTNNHLDKGCFEELWDMAFSNTLVLAIVLGVLGALQLLLILLAIGILCADDNAKKNKIRPSEKRAHKGKRKVRPQPEVRKPTNRVQRRNNPQLMKSKY